MTAANPSKVWPAVNLAQLAAVAAAAAAAAVQLLSWPLQVQAMLLPQQLLRLAAAAAIHVPALLLQLLLLNGFCQVQHTRDRQVAPSALVLLVTMLCRQMLLLPMLLLLHVCTMQRPAILRCAIVLLLLQMLVLPACMILLLLLLLQLILARLMPLLLVLLHQLLSRNLRLQVPARCCACLHLHSRLLWCSCSCSVTSRHQPTMQRVHHAAPTLRPSTTPSLWRNKQLHLLLLLKLLLQLRHSLQSSQGAASTRS
jgi:hypothetical protein